jgi:hypothetical protein
MDEWIAKLASSGDTVVLSGLSFASKATIPDAEAEIIHIMTYLYNDQSILHLGLEIDTRLIHEQATYLVNALSDIDWYSGLKHHLSK